MATKLLQKSLSRLLELCGSFSNLKNDFAIREVLQTIVDVRSLMEDLQQSLCPLKETFLNSRKTFSLLVGCLRVLDNLIQHRFVLPHCLITQVRILSLISKDIFDTLSFERSLFLCPLTTFTLVG